MDACGVKVFLVVGLSLLTNSLQTSEFHNNELLKEDFQRNFCFIRSSESKDITSPSPTESNNVTKTKDPEQHIEGYNSLISGITDRTLRLIERAINYTFKNLCKTYTSKNNSLSADFCKNLQAESSQMFAGVSVQTQETFEERMMDTLACLPRVKAYLKNDQFLIQYVDNSFATLISPRRTSYQLHLPRSVTGHCQLPKSSMSATEDAMVKEGLLLLVSVSHEIGRLMSLPTW